LLLCCEVELEGTGPKDTMGELPQEELGVRVAFQTASIASLISAAYHAASAIQKFLIVCC
jgi:hypothetical protein